jgi:hypothetical protein
VEKKEKFLAKPQKKPRERDFSISGSSSCCSYEKKPSTDDWYELRDPKKTPDFFSSMLLSYN